MERGQVFVVDVAWLAAGGFLGAVSRYATQAVVTAVLPSHAPFGTLLVNVTGSFVLGWMAGGEVSDQVYLFLGTGFFGAFTTFSTFKLESFQLLRNKTVSGLMYMGLMYSLGMGAGWLGFSLGI